MYAVRAVDFIHTCTGRGMYWSDSWMVLSEIAWCPVIGEPLYTVSFYRARDVSREIEVTDRPVVRHFGNKCGGDAV